MMLDVWNDFLMFLKVLNLSYGNTSISPFLSSDGNNMFQGEKVKGGALTRSMCHQWPGYVSISKEDAVRDKWRCRFNSCCSSASLLRRFRALSLFSIHHILFEFVMRPPKSAGVGRQVSIGCFFFLFRQCLFALLPRKDYGNDGSRHILILDRVAIYFCRISSFKGSKFSVYCYFPLMKMTRNLRCDWKLKIKVCCVVNDPPVKIMIRSSRVSICLVSMRQEHSDIFYSGFLSAHEKSSMTMEKCFYSCFLSHSLSTGVFPHHVLPIPTEGGWRDKKEKSEMCFEAASIVTWSSEKRFDLSVVEKISCFSRLAGGFIYAKVSELWTWSSFEVR